MRVFPLVLTLLVATAAMAAPATDTTTTTTYSSPIPGYPAGSGSCLNDSQAQFLVNVFKSILVNPDRQAAKRAAQAFLARNFVETSDSLNLLIGKPLGVASFSSRDDYIAVAILGAPAIPALGTLQLYHDCTHILWEWQATGIGKDAVKGFNSMTIANPATGQMTSNNLEFNSLAWAIDSGWTVRPPPST